MLRFALVLAASLGTLTNAMAVELSPVKTCVTGVVDVGSTGSRLHVYTYDCEHQSEYIKEVWSKKVTPGFSSLELQQSVIDNYLDKLFDGAPPNMPVYFYATAGMRLLSEDKQQLYYDVVKHWFQHSVWSLLEARTITGRDEGVFAWLAVNQERKDFPGSEHEDVGVMDMGGASVQLVTSVVSAEGKNPDDLVHVEVDHKDVMLFVHSFLGLGATLVHQQFLNTPSCFSEGYPLPDGSLGHGNAEDCEKAIDQLINGVHGVDTIVQPVLSAETAKSWYVLGGLSYLLREKIFYQDEKPNTSGRLIKQADATVCRRAWADLRLEYPEYKRLPQGCFMASYYYALLNKGYGLDAEEPIYLTSNNAETDWTLGVVLRQH